MVAGFLVLAFGAVFFTVRVIRSAPIPAPATAIPENPSNPPVSDSSDLRSMEKQPAAAVPAVSRPTEVQVAVPRVAAERSVVVKSPGTGVSEKKIPGPIKAPPPITPPAPPVPSVVATAKPAGLPERPPKKEPVHRGTIAIVIDDAGNNLRELEPFLRFPGPLTIAVLPGLPHSAEAARRARAAGKEVILHQPMEAVGGQNPGPGAIYEGMTEEQIRDILQKNVNEVGPLRGMNNHQGSKITSNEKDMRIILAFCHEKGLYYLDSKTTGETVVPAVAARIGIPYRERDVFIDNIQEKAAMIRYVQEGLQKAERKGAAVMIGHAWSSQLASTLTELYPELVAQGFTLSDISQIVMGNWDNESFGD